MRRRTALSTVLKFTALMLTFGTTSILTRLIDQDEFGYYSVGLSVVMILSVIVQFGFPTLATREFARLSKLGEWGYIHGLRWYTLTVSGVLYLTVVAIGLFIAWFYTNSESGLLSLLPLLLLLVPLHSLMKIWSGQVRGLDRVIQSQIPELLVRPFILFLCLGIALAFQQDGWGSREVLFVNLGAACAACVWAYIIVRHTLQPATSISGRSERSMWRTASLPLMLMSGISVANQNIDVVLLNILVSPEEVAIYRVSTRLCSLIGFGLAAVAAVSAPQFSRQYYASELVALEILARKGALLSIGIALPFVVLFLVMPTTILELAFGPGYGAGANVLIILTLGQLFNSACGVLGVLATMTGNERLGMTGVAVAVVSSSVLIILLVPIMGIAGAAVAQAMSFIIWNCLLAWLLSSRLEIMPLPILPRRTKGAK